MLDGGTDGEGRARVELEHRLGEHVGRRVPQRVEALIGPVGHDADRLAVVQLGGQVDLGAVDLADERRLGQSRPDVGGEIGHGRARGQRARGTVGKGNRDLSHGRRWYRRARTGPAELCERWVGRAIASPMRRLAPGSAQPVRRANSSADERSVMTGSSPGPVLGASVGFEAYSCTYVWPDSWLISYINSSVISRNSSGSPSRDRKRAGSIGPTEEHLDRHERFGTGLVGRLDLAGAAQADRARSGAPVRIDRRATPVRPLWRLPERERVPSG